MGLDVADAGRRGNEINQSHPVDIEFGQQVHGGDGAVADDNEAQELALTVARLGQEQESGSACGPA